MTAQSHPWAYPREMKPWVHIKTYTEILIAASFVVAKNWKQSKGPSAGE